MHDEACVARHHDAWVKQPMVSVGRAMKTPAPINSAHAGPQSHRGPDLVAQTVQELLRAAAMVNHQAGAAAYFPETFLTRW